MPIQNQPNRLSPEELSELSNKIADYDLGTLDLNTQPAKNSLDKYIGSTGILVSNGTVAIEAALVALNIGPGDEVIVPIFTWIATASAVERVGAIPVLADVEKNSLCICPKSIMRLITNKTKAIIPVHIYNRNADMESIIALAKSKNILVIEDCAHAHGARLNKARLGTIGDAGRAIALQLAEDSA